MINFTSGITDHLSTDDLERLFEGRTGILRLASFLTCEQRNQALGGLTDELFPTYDPLEELGGIDPESKKQLAADLLAGSSDSQPPISRRLGLTLYEFVAKGNADDYSVRRQPQSRGDVELLLTAET